MYCILVSLLDGLQQITATANHHSCGRRKGYKLGLIFTQWHLHVICCGESLQMTRAETLHRDPFIASV